MVKNFHRPTNGGSWRLSGCDRSAQWLGEILLLAAGALAATLLVVRPATGQTLADRDLSGQFVHPGLLHGQEDVRRLYQQVRDGKHPWKDAYALLSADRHAAADWRLRGPHAQVIRGSGGSGRTNDAMADDAQAAYLNAIQWIVTRDRRHADKAVEILNAWSGKLQRMGGHDVQLAAGLNGFLMVNAAELLRYTDAGWSDPEAQAFEAMLYRAVYPAIEDFAPFANGNWDAACIKTVLAIGVFCEDREIFARGVDYFLEGAGNGRITHYVINATGQTQESGRDQQHVQLGLGCLAEACEIAWRQGVDLYSAHDHRLLAGYEYTASYLLGNDVPFVQHVDTTGKYRHREISSRGRDRVRPVFEIAYAHYVQRQGLAAPRVTELLNHWRPEGAAHRSDHPGYGTALFFREAPQASGSH